MELSSITLPSQRSAKTRLDFRDFKLRSLNRYRAKIRAVLDAVCNVRMNEAGNLQYDGSSGSPLSGSSLTTPLPHLSFG